jgi:hypothetical protein
VKLRGLDKVDWLFVFSCAAHNLLRLPPLLRPPQRTLELRNIGIQGWLSFFFKNLQSTPGVFRPKWVIISSPVDVAEGVF